MAIKTAAEIWRDYEFDGVPASGPNRPDKREIRPWAIMLESMLAQLGLGYATLALLNADLAHPANTLAMVYADTTPANNGIYQKSGGSGSGSWTRVGDLPDSIVNLTVIGGTANAIQASAAVDPVQPGRKLYLMTPTSSNTGATTISVNGGTPVAIKNAFNSSLASGSLIAGNPVVMIRPDGDFRLLIAAAVDGDAILADAVAARDAAIAAAASVAISAAADRVALKALNTTNTKTALMREAGREGLFVFKSGDFSAQVAADTKEGIHIKADGIAATAGAWVRVRTDGVYNVKWFGSKGDNATNDSAAIQAAIDLCQTNLGGTVLFPAGGYLINTGLVVSAPLVRLEGVGKRHCSIRSSNASIGNVITISAARCAVENLSIFHQVVPSASGALITMGAGAVQCTISDLDMVGGGYCFRGSAGSTDVLISDCVMRLAWSGNSVYTQGAGAYVFDRCLFNQDWPVAVPSAANDKTSAGRQNSTAYALKDYTTYNGLLLQCGQAGTSGASGPTVTGAWYGTAITDGTVIWYIAGNSDGAGVQVDSASTYITFKDCDFTGSYVYGARVTNGLGTTPPDVIRFHDCTVGGVTLHGINISAGRGVWIEGCEIQACVGNNGFRSGIVIGSSITGEMIVRGNRVTAGFASGLFASHTVGSLLIQGNEFLGLAAGINIQAGVRDFVITGNNVGGSSVFGNNTTGISVAAGTSDFYIISQNRVHGATTGVSDGGSGGNKSVTANF
ncbi:MULTISPECIES: glycosyl hydrolase family 28-related protein [unclassified Bradyrhizobium]